MQILLVDDNPLMQQVISRYLAALGYSVAVACDGAEALGLAAGGPWGLLVIDMRLPDRGGDELLAELRRLPGLERCPALAVSGLGEGERERIIGAGFDMYLAKPVDMDELSEAVRRYLAAA